MDRPTPIIDIDSAILSDTNKTRLIDLLTYLNYISETSIIYSTFPIHKQPVFNLIIKERPSGITLNNIVIGIKITYTYWNKFNFEDFKDIEKVYWYFEMECDFDTDIDQYITNIICKIIKWLIYGKEVLSFDNILKAKIPIEKNKFDYTFEDTISHNIYKETDRFNVTS